jgi:hypothetical protein
VPKARPRCTRAAFAGFTNGSERVSSIAMETPAIPARALGKMSNWASW